MLNLGKDEQGLFSRQKINGFTLLILATLGFGSITYGYSASIIGTTLGTTKPYMVN